MEKTISTTNDEETRRPAVQRASEALFFTGVILISSLAVIAVAIAAPFILAASAVAGFLTKNKNASGWRPVSA